MKILKEDFFDTTWFEKHDIKDIDTLAEMQQAYDEDFLVMIDSLELSDLENSLNDLWNFLLANNCKLPNAYYIFSGKDLKTIGKLDIDIGDNEYIAVISRYDENLEPLNTYALKSALIALDIKDKRDRIKSFSSYINKYLDNNTDSLISLYTDEDREDEDE